MSLRDETDIAARFGDRRSVAPSDQQRVAAGPQHRTHRTRGELGSHVRLRATPRLFEPFPRMPTTERRADSIGRHAGRGAGLGLSIVRSVVRAHEGDVHASLREDGGLMMKVRIPMAPEASIPNAHG